MVNWELSRLAKDIAKSAALRDDSEPSTVTIILENLVFSSFKLYFDFIFLNLKMLYRPTPLFPIDSILKFIRSRIEPTHHLQVEIFIFFIVYCFYDFRT